MSITTTPTVDRLAVRHLIEDLHTAGWRHSFTHEEGDRDWETGAYENSGYLIHHWTRRGDEIQMCWDIDHQRLIGSIVLGPSEPEDRYGADDRIQVAVGRVEQYGVAELHRLAVAAGVLPEARRARP